MEILRRSIQALSHSPFCVMPFPPRLFSPRNSCVRACVYTRTTFLSISFYPFPFRTSPSCLLLSLCICSFFLSVSHISPITPLYPFSFLPSPSLLIFFPLNLSLVSSLVSLVAFIIYWVAYHFIIILKLLCNYVQLL